MKKLTPQEERYARLSHFGIPEQFFNSIGNIEELEFQVQEPKGAYFYFPTMTDYQIFSEVEVTPIFDCDETFYALFEKEKVSKIVRFELENDEIYTDYGLNWNLLLLDVLWSYYDVAIEEKSSKALFCAVGKQLGFKSSEKLFQLLHIPEEELEKKMNTEGDWKIEIAKELKLI